ncbi:ESSS subunit of NADH:ubiquinone oxidoreductase (complex I)-domain containing protein [Rhodotorula toruloides]|uniref:NADH dehydrogenase [ubiquinone] 1 beta subcomplex subunit 11, mitochondrial n=1 Tax=Rhodotorula toruloides TaxID=5286 RepID=A0A2T0AIC6_RHOTO|nr:ESSS subunit of NADH:ubiquinone oxidoreductase (complex I)-domain containing protein [Rhodotorula toruloides]
MLLSDRFLATPTGQKRVKEDWENIYYYGFGGTCLLTAIGLYYKRDTSIQTWARAEAMKKMEAEGTLPTYERS